MTDTTAPKPTWTTRITALSSRPWFLLLLFAIEVLETTILPLPYEAIFVALCLMAPLRIWQFLAVTVLGSAAAAAILYCLGAYYAPALAETFGIEAGMAEYTANFAQRGGQLVFLGATTPVPSYLVNLAAGASGYPFWSFLAIFSGGRLIRFGVLAICVFFFGDAIAAQWQRLPLWARRLLLTVIVAAFLYWLVTGFI